MFSNELLVTSISSLCDTAENKAFAFVRLKFRTCSSINHTSFLHRIKPVPVSKFPLSFSKNHSCIYPSAWIWQSFHVRALSQTATDRSELAVRWYRTRWRFVFAAKFSRNLLFIAVQILRWCNNLPSTNCYGWLCSKLCGHLLCTAFIVT